MSILLYHKIDTELKSVWYVTPDVFKEQMMSLKNKKVVYLDDYDPTNPNHVVITFDGVYKNILKYAAPILKEMNYPFECFITGDYVGKDNSFDTPEPLEFFADKDELKELLKFGGRLQWHTNTHKKFDENLSLEEVEYEMQIPKELYEIDKNGYKWFAYPHGELTEDKINIVKKYFRGALSCYQGNDNDVYMLDRIMVFQDTKLKNGHLKEFIQKIFSVKNLNNKKLKCITILGFKYYLKYKKNKFKILVAYHKPDKLYKNKVLVPIHCGRNIAMEKSKDGIISKKDYDWLIKNTIGDNSGDNISHLNREVNEWSAIYWAFKNYDKLGNPDYIGLCHYRRFFKLNNLFNFKIPLPIFYTNNLLNLIFRNYNFLFRRGFKIENPNLHTFDPFQAVIGLSPNYHPNLYKQYLNFKQEQKYYCNNMFIMSRDDFFEMCEELIPIIKDFFNMEKKDINERYLTFIEQNYESNIFLKVKTIIENNNNEFPRMIGYIMEYLTCFYFMHLRDKYKEKSIECDIKKYPYKKFIIF